MLNSKIIAKNFFSLSIAELANKGIMFVTTAYLARVISPSGFGIIGFANSFIIYFSILASLGFNVVGMREIARNRSDMAKYVNSILTVRIALSCIVYIFMSMIVLMLDKPIQVKYALFIIGFNLFSTAIMTDWVYQAIEKMEILAVRQVFTSMLNLAGILLLVNNPDDIVVAIAVSSGAVAINALWMMIYYIRRYGKISLTFDMTLIKKLFPSALSISFNNLLLSYSMLNIILVNVICGDKDSGIFNASYKFMLLVAIASGILQSTFFPVISRADSIEEKKHVMRRFSDVQFGIGTILAMTVFAFAKEVTLLAYGPEYAESASVLRILMLDSVMVYCNITVTTALIGWGMENKMPPYFIAGALLNLGLNFILTPVYRSTGSALSLLSGELVIFSGMSIIYYGIIRKTFFFKLLKFLTFSIISAITGYLIMLLGIPFYICAIICIVIYVCLNFAFKTINMNEIKGIFAR